MAMIYRSVVLGLLGALVLLQAQALTVRHTKLRSDAAVMGASPVAPSPVIVHISQAGAGADPWLALGLAAPELDTIDGAPVRQRCADHVGVYDQLVTRWQRAAPGDFIELGLRDGRHLVVLVVA